MAVIGAFAMTVGAFPAVAASGSTTSDKVIAGQSVPGALPASVANGPRWVDVYGFCRTIDGPAAQAPLPLGSAAEWQAFRQNAPASLGQTVCCRPQSVTLCQGAAGGTVGAVLPYTAQGSQQSPVATCTDQWGQTYTDSQTWSCGQTGSGVMADGKWNEVGDTYTCTPNAFTSACSASCGGGTQYVYDSCGNLTGTQACNTQSCCNEEYGWTIYGACVCNGSWQYNQAGYYCMNTSRPVTVYGGCGNVLSSSTASCGTIFKTSIPAQTCAFNSGQGSGVCGAGMGPSGPGGGGDN